MTPAAEAQVITLAYRPRKWARRVLHGTAEEPNFKRYGVYVIHRRGGKTTGILNHHVRLATDDALEARRLKTLEPAFTDNDIEELTRGRQYAHILPLLKQAKLTSWPLLKEAVAGLPHKKNESELSIEFPAPPRRRVSVGPTAPGAPAQLGGEPGRTVRLFGGDNSDGLRGGRFSGASYDEYQDHSPYLHGTVMSKALADRLGYAFWAGTIKGKNQLYQAHKAAQKDLDTYATLWQDVDVSLRTEEGATITALKRALEDDRKQVAIGLMLQTEFDQEWYLSPEAAIKGAIFGKEMAMVRQRGGVLRSVFDPMLPVDTDWDLGIADHMTIWGSQSTKSGEVRLIFAYSNQGEGIPHYINWLNDERTRRGFVWGKHYAPGDIEVRELTTGKSRRETAKGLGIDFHVVPITNLSDSINAVRLLLPRCWFEDQTTEMGREALMQYRWGWNETLNEFTKEPVHDWASHFAAAFRGLATRHQVPREDKEDDFNPYADVYVAEQEDTSWMG